MSFCANLLCARFASFRASDDALAAANFARFDWGPVITFARFQSERQFVLLLSLLDTKSAQAARRRFIAPCSRAPRTGGGGGGGVH